MKLLDFRIDLARTLCAIGMPKTIKQEFRRPELQKIIEIKTKKPIVTLLFSKDVRLDYR